MNVLGIGVDIVEVVRFRDTSDLGFISKFLSDEESMLILRMHDPSRTLAGRFAAKEAIIKAASAALPDQRVFFRDIVIRSSEAGAPIASIDKEGCDKVKILLSISHTDEQAIAFAMIVRKDDADE